MKKLVLVPELRKMGGVANYYSIIRDYLPEEYVLFERGTKKNKIYDFLHDIYKFKQEMKTQEYDLVIINNSTSKPSMLRDYIFIRTLRKKNIKYVIFFRGWHDKKAKNILENKAFRQAIFSADAIIVLANKFKETLASHGYNQQIFVETTTINPNLYKTKKNHYNLLFLARIEEDKGVLKIIKAYQKLKLIDDRYKLTIAGDGSYLSEIKHYITSNSIDDIKLTGYVRGKQKEKVFIENDVYLFASTHEGMPNSLLEAMSYGLVVVTTLVGGLADFFSSSMGSVLDSISPDEIMEKVLSLKQENIEEISKYNIEFANKHFHPEEVSKRVQNIYNSVQQGKKVAKQSWI